MCMHVCTSNLCSGRLVFLGVRSGWFPALTSAPTPTLTQQVALLGRLLEEVATGGRGAG